MQTRIRRRLTPDFAGPAFLRGILSRAGRSLRRRGCDSRTRSIAPAAAAFDRPHPLDGARVLRPRRAAPADAVRPTRAEVNLEALRHNLRVVQKHAGRRTSLGGAQGRRLRARRARGRAHARARGRGRLLRRAARRGRRAPRGGDRRAHPRDGRLLRRRARGGARARGSSRSSTISSQIEAFARLVRTRRGVRARRRAPEGRHRHGAPRRDACTSSRRSRRSSPTSPRCASAGS